MSIQAIQDEGESCELTRRTLVEISLVPVIKVGDHSFL